MKRQIIQIDEEKCNGCGDCIPNCHEGALRLVDGKARLVSDLLCDGLGACVGHCPEGAITMIEREAEPYNEYKVMADMVKKGKNTILAHLKHLSDHHEIEYLRQGIEYLHTIREELGFDPDEISKMFHKKTALHPMKEDILSEGEEPVCSCPGSATRSFSQGITPAQPFYNPVRPGLSHWPVQMHLINPGAAHFRNADLLLTADCVGYALGQFHQAYLEGKKLAIACPKLDRNVEIYLEKLVTLIEEANINTLTVIKMEVPCCSGLLHLALTAVKQVSRKIPVKSVTVGIQGDVLEESWI